MSDIAIRCEGLSKQYRTGQQESYRALRDVITETVTAPFRRLRSSTNGNGSSSSQFRYPATRIIWALDDVSFEVKRGEVVGIIGHNGAGKSTLLKILSRITKPTRGHAEINGRVGSLLEVGTGFHAELTGRENIYLNGAILGMRKADIDRKFDEMVAFAEVETFIDTPVKRFSSGMYVRLAFAVAAHMETEVLLVDEVLAVGDAEFQKRCLGKMHDISLAGRTVLLISHNMAAMRSLCTEVIRLGKGQIVDRGVTAKVVDRYLIESAMPDATPDGSPLHTEHFTVDSICASGTTTDEGIVPLGPATISLSLQARVFCPDLTMRFCIEDLSGIRLFGVDTWRFDRGTLCNPPEPTIVRIHFPSLPLAPGDYRLRIWLVSYLYDFFDELPKVIPFTVQAASMNGSSEHDPRIHGHIATTVIVDRV